jgi:spore coat protein CotH
VSGQDIEGLKKFNLNNGFKDPTLLREKMTLDFCRRHGLAAPRCTYANLYLNDTLWGLYTFIEQIDKTFLGTNFADNDGNLFKGDPMGSLQWYGAMDTNYYHRYELKTNDSLNDWSDLVYLIDKINNTAPQNFFDSMETYMSTSSFIRYWAMNILFANLDSYNGSGHNYYLYHDPDLDKFYFIAWDVNEAFGCFMQGMSISQLENLSIGYLPNGRPLVQKMLADPSYTNLYKMTLCDYILQDFNSSYMDPIIDSISNVIRPSVYADTKKFYSNQQFEDNRTITTGGAPALKPFISNRHASISSQLSSFCFSAATEIDRKHSLLVYPNPAGHQITMDPGMRDISDIRIYNSLGETVYSNHPKSEGPVTVGLTSFSSGIYFYKVVSEHEQISGKLIIEHGDN